jgi:hypothetical protein
MKKKLLISLVFALRFFTVNAQKFDHEIGLVISHLVTPKAYYEKYHRTITQFHVLYNPSFVISEFKNSFLSVGLPVSVGLSAATNKNSERSAGAPVGITTHIPLVLDYKMGDSPTGNGAYFGVGFDYFTFLLPKDANGYYSYGPMLRGGFRFTSGSGRKSKSLSVGLFYKKGLEAISSSTFGLSLIGRR